jgi:hypothetical protein
MIAIIHVELSGEEAECKDNNNNAVDRRMGG